MNGIIRVFFVMVILFIFLSLLILFSSCTYNISMVHTEGSASDVIDTEESTKADISPNLNIPIKPI